MFKKVTYTYLLLIVITYSNAQPFEKGVVIDTVVCNHQTDQSYALYLPSYYSTEILWPIVYIFEPAARGALAVSLFKQSAEDLGYIIVCSNNSKNGSWSLAFSAARAMKNDTEEKLHIDSKRIYTSGFSGGSRAAMVMAKSVYKARGILACAGAYPPRQYMISPEDNIAYAAIVGELDMNYLEHLRMKKELTENGVENMLFLTTSEHKWPAPFEIELALKWLDIKTNQLLSPDKKEVMRNDFTNYGDSILMSTTSYFQLPILQELEIDLALEFELEPADILASKEVQKELKKRIKAEEKEQKQQQEYQTQFNLMPQTRLNPQLDSVHTQKWWMLEADKLKKRGKSSNPNTSLPAKRLLNYVWAGFAESSFRYEEQGDYAYALQLNEVWLHAQPESVWAIYNKARLQALSGEDQKSIESLFRAHELGMERRTSLEKEPAFDHLQKHPKYQALLSQLK